MMCRSRGYTEWITLEEEKLTIICCTHQIHKNPCRDLWYMRRCWLPTLGCVWKVQGSPHPASKNKRHGVAIEFDPFDIWSILLNSWKQGFAISIISQQITLKLHHPLSLSGQRRSSESWPNGRCHSAVENSRRAARGARVAATVVKRLQLYTQSLGIILRVLNVSKSKEGWVIGMSGTWCFPHTVHAFICRQTVSQKSGEDRFALSSIH